MDNCTICKSNKIRRWGVKNGFQLYRCDSCTHLFADLSSRSTQKLDVLPEEDFRSIITNGMMENDDAYYRHLLVGEHEGFHTYITFKVIHELLKSLDPSPNGSWLDIGAGSGYLVEQVGKLGWSAIGIEPGGWGQIAAREKGVAILKEFLREDTFSEKFDVISATDVLEHQSNPASFTELIKSNLKPDGIIIFSIPFADSLFAKLQRTRWSMIAPPTHCQFFNHKSLQVFAAKMQLEIIRVVQYNSTKFRVLSRFKVVDNLINKIINANNWGDQAVIVLKVKK